MSKEQYKWGIFFNNFKGMSSFGIGIYIDWSGEKYFYVDLFTFELAIGRTTKS